MNTRSNERSVLVDRDGAVATLTFNRPHALNAIDVPMAEVFLAAVKTIASDRSVRAVLLRGAGKGFVAGGDLTVLQTDPQKGAASLIGLLHEAVALLGTLNAPVVAAVHGVAAQRVARERWQASSSPGLAKPRPSSDRRDMDRLPCAGSSGQFFLPS